MILNTNSPLQLNKNKFIEIYQSYFKFIYRYFYKRVPNFQDAEDLTSEVFTALWSNFEKVDENKDVKFFIIGIARNKLNDFLRKKYRFDLVLLDSEILDITQNEEESPSQESKSLNVIDELVFELSEKYKNIYDLKYKKNFTFSQIAKHLNITENNAKVLNNRLIKKLRELWTMKKA